MRSTGLRKAIKLAEKKQNEADLAVQAIQKHLAFSGFDTNDEPVAVMCSGNEIILEWHGAELDINSVVDYMENGGFITPDCFVGILD